MHHAAIIIISCYCFADGYITQYDRLVSSVRPSVTLCIIIVLRVGVGGWKLYKRVPRRALPNHLFCRRMYRSATAHHKKPTAEISAPGIAMSSVVTWPWLLQTRHFWRFGSAAIPYAVRSTLLATATLLCYCW